jgi:AraC-like DNA-binding protein
LHDIIGEKSVPMHKHAKGQFVYVEGRGMYVYTHEKSYFLPSRHFMWIPAQTYHSLHVYNPNVVVRNLYIPHEENEGDFFRKCGIYPASDLLLLMIQHTSNWIGNISMQNRAAYHFVMGLKHVLPERDGMELELVLPTASDERLQKILLFMEDNVHLKDNFSAIASHFNFSERTLSRLFNKDLGVSFGQYNVILKMIKAIQLLLDGKYPVSEVAEMVGYSSVPTFSNSFTKMTGMRPTEFTKLKKVL